MHLVRTDFMVRPAGNGEFEAVIATLGDARKGQPGYLGQTLLQSYSHPSQYTVTARYENGEAVRALFKSDAFVSFIHGLPAGLFAVAQQEVYESVLDVDADNLQASDSRCEVLTDWMVRTGAATDFERSRQQLFEIRKQQMQGFVSNRLRRSAGTPGRYLLLGIYTDGESARAGQSVPAVQTFNKAHPYSAYAGVPPTIQAYHVLHRM